MFRSGDCRKYVDIHTDSSFHDFHKYKQNDGKSNTYHVLLKEKGFAKNTFVHYDFIYM